MAQESSEEIAASEANDEDEEDSTMELEAAQQALCESEDVGNATEKQLENESDILVDGEDMDGVVLRAVSLDAYEASVVEKMDAEQKAVSRADAVQRCLRELKAIVAKSKPLQTKLKNCQRALAESTSGSSATSSRRCRSLLDEQEHCAEQLDELVTSQRSIVQELMAMNYDVASVELVKTATEEKSEVEASDVLENDAEEETEQQKHIRLGEMTAFGKALAFKKGENEQETYRQYVADQKALAKQSKATKSKKRKKKESSRKDEKRRKRPPSPSSSPCEDLDHGTDDSDWDYSEDEDGTAVRKSRRGGLDDGDRDQYLARLHRSRDALEMDSSYEELDGGLRVPSRIWDRLYNYQKVAVQWLWELHQQKVGGLLGDEMGLGKTIQIIAFLASMSFSHRHIRSGRRSFGPVLLVTPTTVMHQWVKEFHAWWPIFRVAVLHDSGSHSGSRPGLITSIVESSGVLITSFSGVTLYKDLLHKHDFQYVILDEGHKIRNPDAQITLSVKMFATPHRLILSGSPLQNNLKELWSLFDFIYPGKLGTLPVFMQQFSVPITLGGYANASRVQVATAYKCATVLRDTINPYLLRRMKADVRQHIFLPEKNEQVLFCKLTDEQREMYKSYIDSGEIKSILDGRLQIFVGLINLRKMCNHPDLYDGGPKHFGDVDFSKLQPHEKFGYWRRSGKMVVIASLLKLWKKQNHRVLLFTQSKQMLVILEHFVSDKGYSYLKMDGTTSISSRQPLIDRFNSSPDIFVFLLTTKVGGLGINLTGANRIILFDPDWNPSTDVQARERAWRIGQEKQVTIYRLMTAGTIEEKIYHRQIFKQFLVNRVLKDPKQRRFFKSNDLYELFTLNEGTSDRTETSAIFEGTDSDVRPQAKRRRPRPRQPREARPEPVTDALKPVRKEQPSKQHVKATVQKIYESPESKSSLSESERERIMRRVREISQKISGQSSQVSEKKKKKTRKKAKLEGQRIPHLVKSDVYKNRCSDGGEEDARAQSSQEQDSYVLSKLFKKSGVHSAVQHDRIMEGGEEDFALIEGEAERVAKLAVEELRRSRRQCFRADAGIPTWTGANGAVANRPRFGAAKSKKSKSSVPDEAAMFSGSGVAKGKLLTSTELLAKMKQRNRYLPSGDELFQPDGVSASTLESPSAEQLELLSDIRNFVAFQATADGRATTDELLDRFRRRLPPKQSPLFKAMLELVCSFHRNSDGKGVWTLKPDLA